jgi:hypothetical protein
MEPSADPLILECGHWHLRACTNRFAKPYIGLITGITLNAPSILGNNNGDSVNIQLHATAASLMKRNGELA